MQHTIELPHVSLGFIELPNGKIELTVRDRNIQYYYEGENGRCEYKVVAIPDGYSVLAIYPDISEEQAAKVVERHHNFKEWFRMYGAENRSTVTTTAIASFPSLLTANNIDSTKRWAVLYHDKK